MESTIQRPRHEPKAAAAALLAGWTLLAAALAGGCVNASEYRFITPDTAAATGSEVPVVTRLLRAEILGLESAVKDQPVMIALVPGDPHAAFTSAKGYASATVTLPAESGKYPLTLNYQDLDGVQAAGEGASWAIDPAAGVLLADLDITERPADARRLAELAARLSTRDATGAPTRVPQVVYAVAAGALKAPEELHRRLAAAGAPEGPVLSWAIEGGEVVGPLAILAASVQAIACVPSPDEDFHTLTERLGLKPCEGWDAGESEKETP